VALLVKKWTISGEILLVGDSPACVKLAAFYTHSRDFYYASLKSSVSPLRVSDAAAVCPPGGAFTLHMDVSRLSPTAGDYIYLILWADENANDAYDTGEDWKYVIPLFDDCIFQGATDCVYYYDDKECEAAGTGPGWNQSIGAHRFSPVGGAHQEGARLSNEPAWEYIPRAGVSETAALHRGS
jgi:hypothetical protein